MFSIAFSRKAISVLLSICFFMSVSAHAQNLTIPVPHVPVPAPQPSHNPTSDFSVGVGVAGAFASMILTVCAVSIAFWALITRDPSPISGVHTDGGTHSGLYFWIFDFGSRKYRNYAVRINHLIGRFLTNVDHRFLIFHKRKPGFFSTATGLAFKAGSATISCINRRKDRWYKWQHKFSLGDHLRDYRAFPAAIAAADGNIGGYLPLPMQALEALPPGFMGARNSRELYYYLRSFQEYSIPGWSAYVSLDWTKLWLKMDEGIGIFVDFNHNPEAVGLPPYPTPTDFPAVPMPPPMPYSQYAPQSEYPFGGVPYGIGGIWFGT